MQSLAALAAAPALLSAQTKKPMFRAINLNHVTVATNDLNRTKEFYQRVFGTPHSVRTKMGSSSEWGSVASEWILLQKQKKTSASTISAIGIEGFDPDKARKALAAQSIETFTELGTGVYFRDSDTNKVQVCAPNYPD